MPQKTSPFLEGKWGWNYGENNWNTGADENWLKFSYMFDRNVDGIVSSLPPAVNGKAYFNTTDNRFYFVVDGTYYSSPCPKWFVFVVRTTGEQYQFDGTSTNIIPSNAGIVSRLEAVELTLTNIQGQNGSSLVGYQPAGSGAINTTVQAKLRQTKSLEDFGAVGDGVTDDSSKISSFESEVKHSSVNLNGKTYLSNFLPVGNVYYNGYFKVAGRDYRQDFKQPVSGAALEDYSTNTLLRYDIQEINGSTVIRGAQAFAFDERGRYLYLTEGGAITRYAMDGDDLAYPIDTSGLGGTALGHQGLAVEYLQDSIRLWTTSSVGGRYAARVQYSPNIPITTAEVYELFDGNNVFANSTSCTPTISTCGRYLVAHGTVFGDVSNTKIRVFELSTILSHGPGDCTNLYLYEWSTQNIVDALNPMQGIACDGSNVYLNAGGTGFTPDVNKRLYVFTLQGQVISKDDNVTIGRSRALLDGDGTRWEPEGLSIISCSGGTSSLMVGILSGQPSQRRFRIYACGLDKPVLTNSVSLIGNHKGSIASIKSTGRDYVAIRSRDALDTGSGINLYGNSDPTQPGGIADFTGGLTRRVTDTLGVTTLSCNSGNNPLVLNRPDSGAVLRLRRGTTDFGYVNMSTANIGLFGLNGAAVQLATGAADTATVRWQVDQAGSFLPFADNSYSLGSDTRRPSFIIAISARYSGPVQVGQYTLSTLPSASAFNGYEIDVTDATGGPKRCRSNGTVWQILNTTTTVS